MNAIFLIVVGIAILFGGMFIGYEWGFGAGMGIGKIMGAIDRDREIRNETEKKND